MNILLVDDDYYIVEAVKTMIDWEKTGIDGIYTALDASSARHYGKYPHTDHTLRY